MIDRASPKKTVLLVDDEKNLTQMLGLLLETRGYQVQTACSAEEAYRKVSCDVDLILLDLVLPDHNGFEVCERLKKNSKTRHIPIIMLSAHSLSEDKLEGLYLGADDFLSKPCEHEELLARMEAVMRRGNHNGNGDGKNVNPNEEAIIYELRHILDEALVVPHFQPIFTLHPFRLYGFEMLTRPSSESTLSNPETFFKAALRYGLYTDLEMLSWSKALGVLSQFITDEMIFFNCNPYFIESSQFARVKALFEKNHISPENVVLEITERSVITNFELFYQHLHSYRQHGFRFAVDDVGGGYSSLESIVEIKPEVVKIDYHLIKELKDNPFKQSIIRFISSLCRENKIISVGEGIESQDVLDIVRQLGVDAVQGYHLCRPTAKIDMAALRKLSL